MKNMKILSILLALVMLFTVQIPICAADASATLTAVQSEITSQNGNLEIRLDSTEPVLGGSFNLVYDSSVLEFDSFYSGKYNCQINASYAVNRIRVSFAATTGTTSDVVLTFRFRPKTSTSCTASFSFEEVTLYNEAGKNVPTTAQGTVCDVTIIKPITDFRLSTDSLTMGLGEKVQMSYHLTPEDASVDTVTWTSYDNTIATIDQNGLVTAKRAGTVSMRCAVRDRDGGYRASNFTVTVYQKPNLAIGKGYLAPGESITLAVRLDTVGATYTSGSLNLLYDPTMLLLTSAELGTLLNGCMATVNPSYRENAVRLNFLGQGGIRGSGEICLLTFTALQAGETRITAEQILLYTENQQEHDANVGGGTVGIGTHSLSLKVPEQITAWEEFTSAVSFAAAAGVAGGSLTVSYDESQFRFLGYTDVLQGFSVTVNENYEPGKIKISFAGTQGVAEGDLLKLRFISRDNPAEALSCEISPEGELYTQDGTRILPTAATASFVLHPDEEPPEAGDVDKNDLKDTRDATALLQYLSGDSGKVMVESLADLNGDGEITETDMDYLMKLLAGWDPSQIQ